MELAKHRAKEKRSINNPASLMQWAVYSDHHVKHQATSVVAVVKVALFGAEDWRRGVGVAAPHSVLQGLFLASTRQRSTSSLESGLSRFCPSLCVVGSPDRFSMINALLSLNDREQATAAVVVLAWTVFVQQNSSLGKSFLWIMVQKQMLGPRMTEWRHIQRQYLEEITSSTSSRIQRCSTLSG